MSKRMRITILSVVVCALTLASFQSAFARFWMDPPIPGTPYHVWVPDGASVNILAKERNNGTVHFKVEVRFQCDEGTYDAGINESAEPPPGDWIYFDTAKCGHKIKFNGIWSGN